MEIHWMGRYRPLVAALVQHSNTVNRALTVRTDIGNGIMLNPQEWQILEYIIEHADSFFSMVDIARELGIPQSSFSRIGKRLLALKLVARYRVTGNRKNIILRPTDLGLQLYNNNVTHATYASFAHFFAELEHFSDEEIRAFTHAICTLTAELPTAVSTDSEQQLIQLD